jgi:LPS export ABC transporter protein LptC
MSCFFVFGCENKQADIIRQTETLTLKEEAYQVESMLTQEGKLRARLRAPLMTRTFSDTIYAEFPNSLHCDFYNDSSQLESWLDARYGKYYEGHNKVYLRDSVVVITTKGDTLKAPDLWWDQNQKIFYTDKYAIYNGIGKNIVGGKGLVATQDLSSVTFHYPTGTVQVSESGMPK